jgi:hypothetical protein
MECGPVEKVQGFIFGRHLTAEQIGELSSHIYARPEVAEASKRVAA